MLTPVLQYITKRLMSDPKGMVSNILHSSIFVLNDLHIDKFFKTRSELFDYSLSCASKNGLVLEFGVAEGESINYLASKLPNINIYGFDCFKGLPEEWGKMPKGYFKTNIPIAKENIKLIVGLFQDTLESFLKQKTEKIRFLHMDADLYSSTFYVLKSLIKNGRIVAGTVIQFDELFNYFGWWQDGEYRALKEIKKEHKIDYETLGYSFFKGYGAAQVSIRINKIEP